MMQLLNHSFIQLIMMKNILKKGKDYVEVLHVEIVIFFEKQMLNICYLNINQFILNPL